jgi:hypothetical protein
MAFVDSLSRLLHFWEHVVEARANSGNNASVRAMVLTSCRSTPAPACMQSSQNHLFRFFFKKLWTFSGLFMLSPAWKYFDTDGLFRYCIAPRNALFSSSPQWVSKAKFFEKKQIAIGKWQLAKTQDLQPSTDHRPGRRCHTSHACDPLPMLSAWGRMGSKPGRGEAAFGKWVIW